MCFLLGINYAARTVRNLGQDALARELLVEQVFIDPEDLACSGLLPNAPQEALGLQQEIVIEFKLNSTEMNGGERGQ